MQIIANKIREARRDHFSYLVSQEPIRRQVKWVDGQNYFLSFPKIFFKLDYRLAHCEDFTPRYLTQGLYVLFAKGNDLFLPPLYNLQSSLYMCMGQEIVHSSSESLLKNQIAMFWQRAFSTDIYEAISIYSRKNTLFSSASGFSRHGNPLTTSIPTLWQAKTKSDPEWIPDENDLVNMNEIWPNVDKMADQFFLKNFSDVETA